MVPMTAGPPGRRQAASTTPLCAYWIALTSLHAWVSWIHVAMWGQVPSSTVSVFRKNSAMASTATLLASAPPACPPMPSATT